MYSTLVISDNQDLISNIRHSFETHSSFVLKSQCYSFTTADILLRKFDFQLLIIEIDSLSETLKWLRNTSQQKAEIILLHKNCPFSTRFLDYRVRAFIDMAEFNDELDIALKSIKNKLEQSETEQNRLDNLLKIATQNTNAKISLSLKNELKILDANDIISISALKNASIVKLQHQKILKINKPINEFEKLTQDLSFVRIHRSYIVNLMHVQQYIKKSGGFIEMTDDSIFPISNHKKSIFTKAVQKFTLHL